MAPAIIDEANRAPLPGFPEPWKATHEIFRSLCLNLNSDKTDWVVFFDTNPSFSIYTELAICGATRLLVPVNADDSSRVAVKALFALLYGTNPPHPFFGNYTFAARAKLKGLNIPKVHLAIGNRFTQHKGAATAFQAFSDAIADQLYEEYEENHERFTDAEHEISDKQAFLSRFVSELRDFNTAGVVAAHNGTPMSKMRQNYYRVHEDEAKVNADRFGLDWKL